MTITSAHVRDGKVTLLFICILYCLQAVAVTAVGAINRKVTSENNIQLSDYKDRGEEGETKQFSADGVPLQYTLQDAEVPYISIKVLRGQTELIGRISCAAKQKNDLLPWPKRKCFSSDVFLFYFF